MKKEIMCSIIYDDPVPVTKYGVPEEVWKVIEKALKKYKEERWQSAAEIGVALINLV